ncbi:MAG: HAMP domain-containing histidine kinase, partial [Kiritimatiellaeota bacterium]|nr:HAMP domain-containing histidine kinase [Kiritimatiellota bacterium]
GEAEEFENSISLSPVLPHWTLEYVTTGYRDEHEDPLAFIAPALIFLSLLFTVGIGAALLARDARRQRLDALRKTTFVSNVSHELRTPLTSIRMYAEMLSDNKVESPEQSGKFLHIIADESRRLSALVSDVLEFGRNKPMKLEECDVGEIAEMCSGVPVERPALHSNAATLANADAVRQILINLIDNAKKYAGENPEIDVVNAGDAVCVRVMDRGPGIPPRLAKKIFEPFFRADDSNTATVGGFGLGLAIARKLAAAMGGTLTYTPRDGGGSVFTLALYNRK